MNNQQPSYESEHQRVVRVFVSSTFQDMHAEREELVKFTFPELRKRCRERAVEFFDVDLRWGIPDEQRAEGKVLPICLAEIERCRPYFIGLLGERYGWVPEGIDEELAEIQPWLKEHREKSVTELEIIHGVLRNPEMKSLAFFYFRHPDKSGEIEEELKKRPDYKEEPDASGLKLKLLKEEILSSDYKDKIRENYPDTKTLGQLVLDDLWKVIDERFPIEKVPTALERERMEHEAFAKARTRVYIGREEYFQKLDEHVAGDGLPLVLLGESGSGKSALISNWVERYRKEHPEEFIITHFIGSTADSADYVRMLRRIMGEIRERYEPARDTPLTPLDRGESIPSPLAGEGQGEGAIPTDPKKVVEAFPLWLAKASARGKFILELDALNQLEDRDNAPDLVWLPEYFPPNIRVILSTLPGRSLEALKKRNLPAYPIQPIGEEEKKKFIKDYLDQYRKKLNDSQAGRVASAGQTANPLFLRTLLEELHVFGIHEELDNKITHYLKAEKVDDLFELVLERLEQDYDRDRPGLVRDSMSLLWASRRGLSEKELLELIGVPSAFWSPLYLALEASLVSRSGFLNFFHDFLRKAVEDKYLQDSELKRASHLRLADYFEKMELDERKVDELPWQFHQTEDWERLKDCITDMDMFLRLMTELRQYELMGYWLSIGNRFDMAAAYNTMIDNYEITSPPEEDLAYIINAVAFFLNVNARFKEAEPLYRWALTIREKVLGAEHSDTAISLNNLANVLHSKGDYVGAEPLFTRALEITEKVLGREHPQTAASLNNLAELLYSKGDYVGAEPLYRRALTIREKVNGAEHSYAAISLDNLAKLLYRKGDYVGAEPLFTRALEITEKVLGREHPQTAASLNNLADLLYSKRDYVGAEPLYRRALAIHEKVLGSEHPNTAISLNNLAKLFESKVDYVGAEPLFRRALAIHEKVLGLEHPDTAIIIENLAELLCRVGDYKEAELLYRRSLTINEKVLGSQHPNTATILSHLGWMFMNKGNYDVAESLLQRALAIYEKVLGQEHPWTITVIGHLSDLLGRKGDYEGAGSLLKRVLSISGKVQTGQPIKVIKLALLLRDAGVHDQAAALFSRFLENYDEKSITDPAILNSLAICHNELAFHTSVPAKNWEEAEYHYKKSIEFFKELHSPVETANVELNLQTMFHLSGQKVDLDKVKELIRILETTGDKRAEKGHKLLKEIS